MTETCRPSLIETELSRGGHLIIARPLLSADSHPTDLFPFAADDAGGIPGRCFDLQCAKLLEGRASCLWRTRLGRRGLAIFDTARVRGVGCRDQA